MRTEQYEVAPGRWIVREKGRKGKRGKLLGIVEYHEFYTYTATGERVLTGFWKSRQPDFGWKETGWVRADSQEAALAHLTREPT